ncbi:Plasma kallikrein [Trichinella patagoniensis]|uniref:Plasma kallikrein n=1 Tax=Trichinella patagoniensis TaxID=990121 RepID=A0A0V1A2B6_9BILA|nr:Plasma kallikrein [Trichinella patagoniensis]
MRHQQSYQKTKKRFTRELPTGQTAHRNEVSKSKIYAQTKHAFIRYSCPKIINVTDISYETIKSIIMTRARTSKINCENVKMDCGRSAFPLKERNANRIVGGWEANPHSIPWQVYIEIINFPDFAFCGGSIIQLKPACFYLYQSSYSSREMTKIAPHAVSVISGVHNIKEAIENSKKHHYVKNIIIHDSFSKHLLHDIAIVQLHTPILYTNYSRPICLPEVNSSLPKHNCWISGWGYSKIKFSSDLYCYKTFIIMQWGGALLSEIPSPSWKINKSRFTVLVEGKFKCGKPAFPINENYGNRIINGWEAYPHSIPWQVFISVQIFSDVETFCGGTIIQPHPGNSTNFVLTAAHCLQINDTLADIIPPEDVFVIAGIHNVDDENENSRTVVGVKRIINHFNFTVHRPYDISLLQLQSPIFYTKFTRPICLPEVNSTVPENDCWSSGWGYTTSSGSSSSVLLMVSTPLFKLGKYFPFELFDEYEFFAGSLRGGGFLGDSGGPLFCKVNGSYFLYGVSSFFPYFAYPGSLIGYSKVSYFIDWIKETTKCDATDKCL